MKRLLRLLLIVLILALLAILGLAFFAGSLLRVGVEKGGTAALGVDVTVGGGTLNVLTGEIGLSKLNIPNPPEFTPHAAIAAESMSAKADVGSLTSGEMHIPLIAMDRLEVTLDMGPGGSNLGKLADNAKKFSGGGGANQGGAKIEKRMRIDEIRITGTRVKMAQSLVKSVTAAAEVPLPDIHITDVKSGGNSSVTMPELVQRIIDEILAATSKAAGSFPKEIAGQLEKEGKHALEQLQQQLNGSALENAGKDIQKNVEQGVEGVKKGLEGIFK